MVPTPPINTFSHCSTTVCKTAAINVPVATLGPVPSANWSSKALRTAETNEGVVVLDPLINEAKGIQAAWNKSGCLFADEYV